VPSTPICISIAGSDSCAGAGIQADLKTFASLDCYGMSVITAVTAQTDLSISAIEAIPVTLVAEQLNCLLSRYKVSAIKTGLLPSAGHIHSICDILAEHQDIPLIVDPVLSSTSGTSWSNDELIEAYKTRLAPMAKILTPNIDEFKRLFPEEYKHPQTLCDHMNTAILVKGGHTDPADQSLLEGAITDALYRPNKASTSFTHAYLETANTHGTGCTLASAIASYVAHGYKIRKSTRNGIDYLQQVLRSSEGFLKKRLQNKEHQHNLPMNHFH